MEYSKIIAVSGLPGLFELITSKSDGAIVRSLEDKTARFVSGRVHQFSHLESIEIYTVRENVNLVEVLKAIKESKESLPDEKDNNALRKYFEKVFPDIDFERVYASDLKKMVKWSSILSKNDVELKLTEPAAEEEPAPVVKEEKAAEETPAPKAAKKPAAKKQEEAPAKAKTKEKEQVKEKEKPKVSKEKEKPAAKKKAAEDKPKKSAPKKKSGK